MNALPWTAVSSYENSNASRRASVVAAASAHLVPCFILFAICSLLFLYRLGDRDLLSSHEARAAQNAQMLLSEGDWGLPRLFNGRIELQKPPLYYWLVAAFGWLAGGRVDAWVVRLPAALAAFGCVLFLYGFGAKLGRRGLGFWAAAILATSIHFTWLGRVGRIDMALAFAIEVAVGSLYLGSAGLSRGWFAVGYVALAAGIMLKGPIAVVLVGATWLGWVLVEKVRAGRLTGHRSRLPRGEQDGTGVPSPRFFHGSLWWGLPLVILVAAPWFAWANWRTDGWLWDVFFWHHNLERGLGSSDTLGGYPLWYYLPRLAIDLFPWSLALPAAVVLVLKRPLWPADRELRFGAAWLVSMVAVLSCVSFKRADYLAPAYPGAAIFLACAFERFSGRRRHVTLAAGVVVATGVLGWAVFSTWFVEGARGERPYQAMAADIRKLTHRPVIFFRTESHALMFHVGRPLDTILEWENLEVWANLKVPVYFVMPPECADAWREELKRGRLERVFDSGAYPGIDEDRPLVVMRSCPGDDTR